MNENVKIVDEIIDEFLKINEHPRMSKHEKEISEYLFNRCEELGLDVISDDYNNIVAIKKAEKGYENNDTIILQAHMDMVCVSENNFDFLNEHVITIVNKERDEMYAKGTSLGADDGIGVAIILQILKNKNIKRKVVAIFSTDEERGMTGASNIDKKYLDGKYMINIDWEDINTICVSSAGARGIIVKKKVIEQELESNNTYELILSGLPGGHSGTEINKNIPNAIIEIIKIIEKIQEKDIAIGIISVDGGNANNAIPNKAVLKFNTNESINVLKNILCEIDNESKYDIKYEIREVEKKDKKDKSINNESLNDIIKFIKTIPNGVYKKSEDINDFVIASSNIGKICKVDDFVVLEILSRSSEKEILEELYGQIERIAYECNMTLEIESDSPSWPYRKNSKLYDYAKSSFKKVMNKDVIFEPVHAGLECGYFIMKNANIEAISLGPTVLDAHTTNEKVKISDIEKIYYIVEDIINSISENE